MRGRLLIVIVAGFLIGAVAGRRRACRSRRTARVRAVATSGKALIGGPFTLVDQHGKTVTDQDFRGRFMLVFFGFTHCPDICPAELQVMSAEPRCARTRRRRRWSRSSSRSIRSATRPRSWRDYVKNFGARFVGLTGSPEAIAEAAKAYRIAYSKFQEEDAVSSDYSIDHSALVYLMGKDGEYVTHFAYGTPAAKMTETLRRYL